MDAKQEDNSTLVLYESDDEDDTIKVDLSEAHLLMLSEIQERIDGDVDRMLAITIEEVIHQSVQDMRGDSGQIHQAYALLIKALQDTDEIDLQSVVETSIHELDQRVEK